MRIAFFGTGDTAQPYLRALARRRDVQVAAVCDVETRSAEAIAAGWGARVFDTLENMVADSQPEAVWLCVEPRLQGEAVLQCVQRRIPFLVVPPGSSDFERARACARDLVRNPLVTAVGYPARHVDVVREARDFLGDSPIPLVFGTWLCPLEDGPSAGGAVWAGGSILLDAMRYLNGDVTRVRAVTGCPDGSLIQLEFAKGGAGSLTCAAFNRPTPRIDLELLRPECSVVLADGFRSLRVEERDKTTLLRGLNQPADDATTAFLNAVETNDPQAVGPSFVDAFSTLAVCHAAALSIHENRVVEVNELI